MKFFIGYVSATLSLAVAGFEITMGRYVMAGIVLGLNLPTIGKMLRGAD
jgi:hypothetical protein